MNQVLYNIGRVKKCHEDFKQTVWNVSLTCVVLSLQVHVTQLVDIADVHLLLVNLRFVEIL